MMNAKLIDQLKLMSAGFAVIAETLDNASRQLNALAAMLAQENFAETTEVDSQDTTKPDGL